MQGIKDRSTSCILHHPKVVDTQKICLNLQLHIKRRLIKKFVKATICIERLLSEVNILQITVTQ